jgi:hypothetical protein
MREAAKELGVTSHVIRRLIQSHVLAAEQVVPGAPFQIKVSDLQHQCVPREAVSKIGISVATLERWRAVAWYIRRGQVEQRMRRTHSGAHRSRCTWPS